MNEREFYYIAYKDHNGNYFKAVIPENRGDDIWNLDKMKENLEIVRKRLKPVAYYWKDLKLVKQTITSEILDD